MRSKPRRNNAERMNYKNNWKSCSTGKTKVGTARRFLQRSYVSRLRYKGRRAADTAAATTTTYATRLPFSGNGRRRIVWCEIRADRSKQRVTGIRVVALRVECFRREGYRHGDGNFLGRQVGLGRGVAAKKWVLQQPRSRTHNTQPVVVKVRLRPARRRAVVLLFP